MADPTAIRVHQHGANGKKWGRMSLLAAAGCEPDSRCVGRSRGGLTAKIHTLLDANGRFVALKLAPG